jgi:hypothetical protein
MSNVMRDFDPDIEPEMRSSIFNLYNPLELRTVTPEGVLRLVPVTDVDPKLFGQITSYMVTTDYVAPLYLVLGRLYVIRSLVGPQADPPMQYLAVYENSL